MTCFMDVDDRIVMPTGSDRDSWPMLRDGPSGLLSMRFLPLFTCKHLMLRSRLGRRLEAWAMSLDLRDLALGAPKDQPIHELTLCPTIRFEPADDGHAIRAPITAITPEIGGGLIAASGYRGLICGAAQATCPHDPHDRPRLREIKLSE